jgi:hypothetical protein
MIYIYYTTNVDKESFEIFKLKNKQHLMRGLIKIGEEFQSSQRLSNELMSVFDYNKSGNKVSNLVDHVIDNFEIHLPMMEILHFYNRGFDIFIPYNFNISSPLYMILTQFIGALKVSRITDYVLCDFRGDLLCLV